MTLPKILHDRYVLGYVALYLVALLVLGLLESYEIGEAIGVAVIFGMLLPAIAYWSCRSSEAVTPPKEASVSQLAYLGLCLVVVAVLLAFGPDIFAQLLGVHTDTSRLKEIITLLTKLLFFVVIPLFIFSKKFGFGAGDYGIEFHVRKWFKNKQVRALVVLIPLMTLFQLFVGQGAAPVRSGTYSFNQLLWGLPLAFLWLLLEVGLVEEFFFRSLVQSRITAYVKSETAGIVIAGVLFGLAHAPGLFLRGGGANSALGSNPSLLLALGYSIVVLSAAGLFMGVVWSRTRNLLLVMLIHASIDLLPNFDEFAHVWNLYR